MATPYENDLLTEKVIGFAIEAHRQLGPGLLESAYEECLCFELKENGILIPAAGPPACHLQRRPPRLRLPSGHPGRRSGDPGIEDRRALDADP